MKIIAAGFTFVAIFVLFWILGMLIVKGIGGLSVATFTQITPGPGTSGGGLANAMVGSLVLTFLGIAVARRRSACSRAPISPSTARVRSSRT